MRYFILFAVSLFLLIGTAGKLASWFGVVPSSKAERTRVSSANAKQRAASDTMLVVASDRGGHFGVNAVIGGRQVKFLVDTGATMIALTAEDASRLDISPSSRDRKVRLQTANGIITAPTVRLAEVAIGPLQVQDVEAVIMPKGRLRQNLLGMSFLSRLRRYEFRSGQLVMEQ